MSGAAFALLQPFLDTSVLVVALELDAQGVVEHANGAAAARLRTSAEALSGRPVTELVAASDLSQLTDVITGACTSALVRFVGADSVFVPLTIHALARADGILMLGEPSLVPYLRLGDDLAAHANDLAVQSRERSRKLKHLTAEIAEQTRTHWALRRDQEVLPICVKCGRVHTADHGWEEFAEFVQRSGDFLSHGYCETCAQAWVKG